MRVGGQTPTGPPPWEIFQSHKFRLNRLEEAVLVIFQIPYKCLKRVLTV